MVVRREVHIARLALGSKNRAGRLKTGGEAPQLVEAIALDAIDPDPDQPRRHFDPARLQELASSLASIGQLQPIILTRTGERYRILVGERRWRACTLAGLTMIRAIVLATPRDVSAIRIAQLVENEQRVDLLVSELIEAVRDLQAHGFKKVEIATALGKSPGRISEIAALAEAPEPLRVVIDRLGLDLSYQLLRQWRAHPDAAFDFPAHMPLNHVSRITIATIGMPALDDLSATSAPSATADVQADVRSPSSGALRPIDVMGEGTSPRSAPQGDLSLAPGLAGEMPLPLPVTSQTIIGGLLVAHADHGPGHIVFGLATPADHLAISFGAAAPIILHKDAIRIVRAVTADALRT